MHTVSVTALPKGAAFARYVSLLARNQGLVWSAASEAEDDPYLRDSPGVALSLRSAVSASDTSVSLATYGVARDFLELLQTVGVVERLRSRMFPAAFRVKTPVETTSPTAQWVSESSGIPVSSAAFGSVTLDLCKLGAICVLTKELVQFSAPSAEASIIRILRNAIAWTEDRKFLDASVSAVAGQNPAGVTNGGVVIVTSGSTASAISTDLSAMTNALASWIDPVWVMAPKTLAYINGHNDSNLLFYSGAQPYLLGLPVYVTLGSPAQITLLDLGAIALADNGGLDVSVSENATIETDTAPATGDESPIADIGSLKSFFQNNLIGVRIIRNISWARMQAASVIYMVVNY